MKSRVFVINRSIDTLRMKETREILNKNGIRFTRVEATTIDSNSNDTNATDEMIGCALSHIKIWKRAVRENLDYALILEDDVEFKSGWKKTLSKALKELPNDFDMLTLGNFGLKTVLDKDKSPFNFVLYLIVQAFGLGNDTKNTYSSIVQPYFSTGLYGYIVSRRGARQLLKLNKRILFHLDAQISSQSKDVKLYSIIDDIVYQRTTQSTINNTLHSKIKIHWDPFTAIDDKNISYNYYMNVPIGKIRILTYDVIVNAWLIVVILILIVIVLQKW